MNIEKYLPRDMCSWIEKNAFNAGNITLIRKKNMFVTENDAIVESPFFVTETILENIVNLMCKGSIYANQHTLKDGYIPLEEGCRAGITGTCITENGKVNYMRNITAVNIRICREVTGCADGIMPYIKANGRIYNTLIISPPSAGKTTVLRDIARQLGNFSRVGIIDERGEIAKNKDVGKYTFVMEECEKSSAILMMLRSMSPNVIITDEIGTERDEEALETLLNAGVKMICTAHGYDEKDIMRRRVFKRLIEGKVFERLIVLSARNGPGTVENIINNK